MHTQAARSLAVDYEKKIVRLDAVLRQCTEKQVRRGNVGHATTRRSRSNPDD